MAIDETKKGGFTTQAVKALGVETQKQKDTTVNPHIINRLGFEGLYPTLVNLAEKIKSVSFTSRKEAFTAYSTSWRLAQGDIKKLVGSLSPDELGFAWSGLSLTTPPDKHIDDVVASVMSSWDVVASKYVKNEHNAGNSLLITLKDRLREFQTALTSKGKTPVKKDA